ncbi:hypothetical protein JZ751_003652 [Albula glossodonta]|uniref:MOSC domain-containing protein n=1 Tax=Albula glossodonta TaxID=121402 RepID=A0A8T2N8V2_9TELE|nr:hypothetical protein JZ751_003652 [Albula glossodonta]
MDLRETIGNPCSSALLCAVGVVLTVLVLELVQKYLKNSRNVICIGAVSQLVIYPMKSGKGVNVTSTECVEMGLKCGEMKDRHWLVVRENGKPMSTREEPRLVLVLWREGIQGRDCGDEASLWLSSFVNTGKTFRLVQFEPHMSPRNPGKKLPLIPDNEKVAYADICAIMLLSEASVTDLNTRLEFDVTATWFRPNIVISGCEAFEEDSWDQIQIGNVKLRRVMSCSRCLSVTVDPETGVTDRKEPLQTLKTYRMCDSSEKKFYKTSPLFGQYYSVERNGIIQVGDPVYKIGY